MIRLIGWLILIVNMIWFAIVPFAGDYEPPLYLSLGSAAGLITGAILIVGGKKNV